MSESFPRLKIRKILKEPLLHFFVIGGIIFLINNLWGDSRFIPDNNEIYLSAQQIENRKNQWAIQMGRPATESEIEGFVRDYIQDEILSREAKLLGLGDDDIVIRRRLVQKMEFMSSEFTTVTPPSEGELQAYYERNKSEFQIPGNISFYQVFLRDEGMTKEEIEEKAHTIKRYLVQNDIEPVNSNAYGDRTMLPAYFQNMSEEKLFNAFGDTDLLDIADNLKLGDWEGPVRSSFGHHLVYLTERKEARIPQLMEIRREAEERYMSEMKIEAEEEFYQQLRSRYLIKLDEEIKSYFVEN